MGTEDLRRPDRSRYVVDIFYDFLTFTGEKPITVETMQVYAARSDVDIILRDKGLLRLIEAHAQEGIVTLIRCSETQGIVLVHPLLHPGDDMLRIELDNQVNDNVQFDFAHSERRLTKPQPGFDELQKTIEILFPEEV